MCKTSKRLQADLEQSGALVSGQDHTLHTEPSRTPWGKGQVGHHYKNKKKGMTRRHYCEEIL